MPNPAGAESDQFPDESAVVEPVSAVPPVAPAASASTVAPVSRFWPALSARASRAHCA
jgi:hypothetical protein